MKTCFKCGVEKSLRMFYRHPEMGDGHLNKCKDCTKKDAIDVRNRNLDKYQDYDRKRSALPHRVALKKKIYRESVATKAGRKRLSDQKMVHYYKYKERSAARYIAANAIRDGRLTRQTCERCGKKNAHAHHEDYGKPLEIMWLCRKHHGERHREINAARRAEKEKVK